MLSQSFKLPAPETAVISELKKVGALLVMLQVPVAASSTLLTWRLMLLSQENLMHDWPCLSTTSSIWPAMVCRCSVVVQMPKEVARRLNWELLDDPGKTERTSGISLTKLKRDKRVALEYAIYERYGSQLSSTAFKWHSSCEPALVRLRLSFTEIGPASRMLFGDALAKTHLRILCCTAATMHCIAAWCAAAARLHTTLQPSAPMPLRCRRRKHQPPNGRSTAAWECFLGTTAPVHHARALWVMPCRWANC